MLASLLAARSGGAKRPLAALAALWSCSCARKSGEKPWPVGPASKESSQVAQLNGLDEGGVDPQTKQYMQCVYTIVLYKYYICKYNKLYNYKVPLTLGIVYHGILHPIPFNSG